MARTCNVVFQEIREAVAVGDSGADFLRTAALSLFSGTSVELRHFDRLDSENRALFVEMLSCTRSPGPIQDHRFGRLWTTVRDTPSGLANGKRWLISARRR